MITNQYAQIFLHDVPAIDTRSPGEYSKGHFPNAVSLPLMTDSERAQVGTCYKQRGQTEAITLGHQLVNGVIKSQRVTAWAEYIKANPNCVLFCWRGGLRSQTCQQWLADVGVDCVRVEGGYKAMRRFLIDTNQRICQQRPFVILAGHTGSAKTELLKTVATSVDLEQLAHHRGSAFGKRLGGQPTQTTFENRTFIELFKADARRGDTPIVLEDESHLIGRCALPLELENAMKSSPIVVVQTELRERVEHSFHNYILLNLAEHVAQQGRDQGFELFANELRQAMKNIQRRLGGQRYAELSGILDNALAQHRLGDNSCHLHWIEILLRDYYDPMYNFQMEKKKHRVIFRGSPAEVTDFLSSRTT
ncbi:tRNA 2-selenouridine(34) synthase MnmH [Teredinibacter turnerae]|uniref:tRNA 2-selenouridine(34) synthase MnmH n=1 Tax=Teredinibacter turnerae TaxID=2426 RepID=UPI0004221B20|nr:tRNA 2-selenouridine(34) synthase MnmH [Teredinibacter turnerae]